MTESRSHARRDVQLGFLLRCRADLHLEPDKLQQCERPRCTSQPLSHSKRAEEREEGKKHCSFLRDA